MHIVTTELVEKVIGDSLRALNRPWSDSVWENTENKLRPIIWWNVWLIVSCAIEK